ncbi:hypothetical protein K438DRAFT_1545524, partial [Mycena galopus ATCC 62051]
GGRWTELVNQWFSREEGKGFISLPKGHSAKLRPPQVKAWVQRARTGVPDIKDVQRFAQEWTAWWQDINPAWRKITLPMPQTNGPWDFMDFPGPNGFLNVLMCLKWWRERLDKDSNEWIGAVDDVTWVLKSM